MCLPSVPAILPVTWFRCWFFPSAFRKDCILLTTIQDFLLTCLPRVLLLAPHLKPIVTISDAHSTFYMDTITLLNKPTAHATLNTRTHFHSTSQNKGLVKPGFKTTKSIDRSDCIAMTWNHCNQWNSCSVPTDGEPESPNWPMWLTCMLKTGIANQRQELVEHLPKLSVLQKYLYIFSVFLTFYLCTCFMISSSN